MIKTPICDFVRDYQDPEQVRFHMPGHKGQPFLGFENLDLTEIKDADELYHAEGIIQESEKIASSLFGSKETCFGTEGSSQCIRAMMFLAAEGKGEKPLFLAARNVHKAFVYGAALLDAEVQWIYPQESDNLCRCRIDPQELEKALNEARKPVCGVFITSPDYLGGVASISELADVCHRYGTLLMVDNAHGAYLHFLEDPQHPLDQDVDMCCDSAHKTLPALTGGAYLHIGRNCPEIGSVKHAMELFGSSSPSYLIMQSLDLTNRYLGEAFREELQKRIDLVQKVKNTLRDNGWFVEESDPLRITINANKSGWNGIELAERLRVDKMECEYADPDYVVLMVTPQNQDRDFRKLVDCLGINTNKAFSRASLPLCRPKSCISIRDAVFAKHKTVKLQNALGKICGTPTVSCPPAIPIVVSGEVIDQAGIDQMEYYNIEYIDIVNS